MRTFNGEQRAKRLERMSWERRRAVRHERESANKNRVIIRY